MSESVTDGESASGDRVSDLIDQGELDKLNLKLWEKIDGKLPSDVSEADVLSLLSGVFSQDFEIRTTALARLNRLGLVAAQRLVDIMIKNPTDSTLVFQITYALEEIGKRAVPPLIEALKKVELKKPVDLTMFENITQTLIRLNDKSAVPIIMGYMHEINRELQKAIMAANAATNGLSDNTKKLGEFYHTARLRIHDNLGDMNAREGLDDLLLLLDDGRKRVHVDAIDTLRKVGDHRALVPLLRLYPIELTISELGARYIKLTFREIVRREKVTRQNSIFKHLAPEEKDTLDKLFPHLKNERQNISG